MSSNLQKIYNFNLLVALAICAALLLWFILTFFSIVQPNTPLSLLAMVVVVALFLPINLLLKFRNKNRILKLPAFIPKQLVRTVSILTVLIFFIVMVYGLAYYRTAPIKPDGNTFTDKVGNEYTLSQFQSFQLWESAYITSWSIVFITSIVCLPFYNSKTRKWDF